MAFQSKSGKSFTNAPMARMQDRRDEHAKTQPKPEMEAKSKSQGGKGHMKCPHCGGDVELHPADTDQSQDMGGMMPPGNDAAEDSGF